MQTIGSQLTFARRKINVLVEPAAVFRHLYGGDPDAFLYESLEGKDRRGRYSFAGGKPWLVVTSRGERVTFRSPKGTETKTQDPVKAMRSVLNSVRSFPALPPFSGGAVGFMAYDAIRLFESIPEHNADEEDAPDLAFMFPSELIVFDHLEDTVEAIVYAEKDAETGVDDLIEAVLRAPGLDPEMIQDGRVSFDPSHTSDSFQNMVRRAKEYIMAGDIFQVVLSQRFRFPVKHDPFSIYRMLRISNPSPYMYFLRIDGFHVLGSSPEILVKAVGRTVYSRPLAGTRPCGPDATENGRLAKELLADEKERAEHIMLVDLARNDLGRVSEPGTVKVDAMFEIERYSKVMHLVSSVTGKLSPHLDALDVLAAAFPAGTVSGAPKVRAMEIIEELEHLRRGVYAGAIGYLDYSGNLDLCIAIRTLVIRNGMGQIQAGAGIVADSDPGKEYQETINKAKAVIRAVEMAGG